jgi:hypothetical protein
VAHCHLLDPQCKLLRTETALTYISIALRFFLSLTIVRYQTLGPHWSATMLSLIEFAMIPIPVIFYLYGHRIREKSTLIRQMREDREKLDSRKRRAAERAERTVGMEGEKSGVMMGGLVDKKEFEV